MAMIHALLSGIMTRESCKGDGQARQWNALRATSMSTNGYARKKEAGKMAQAKSEWVSVKDKLPGRNGKGG